MTCEPNFDRVARIYRWAEYLSLGTLLEHMRDHYLPELAGSRSALVLGDGDGRFVANLLCQNSELYAVAVDTSAVMLRHLRRRCQFAGTRLQTVQTSALVFDTTIFDATKGVDLIVTHFFFDCFSQTEVDLLVERLAMQVSHGTLWLLSDFAIPSSPLIRPLARLYVRSLYLAFRLLTGLRVTQLPHPQVALAAAGFQRVGRHERLFGVLYTELWYRP